MFADLGEVIVTLCNFLTPRDIIYLGSVNKPTKVLLAEYCKEIWKDRCLKKWDELAMSTSIEDHEWKDIFVRKCKEDTNLESVMKLKQFRSCDWYSCPNGHLYLIGECRLPMQIGKCPTCGVPIGGKSHRMLDNNYRLGRVNRDNMKKKLKLQNLSAKMLEETLDSETNNRNKRITPTMSATFQQNAIGKKRKKEKKKQQNIEKRNTDSDSVDTEGDFDMGELFG